MSVKRLITPEQRKNLKDLKKYKGKNPDNLSQQEIKELIILMAKKFGLL